MASSSSSPTAQIKFPGTKLRPDSSRDEYEAWKEAMLDVLESNNLVSFLVERLMPLEMNTEWKKKDRVVRELIVSAVSEQLHPTVMAGKTASKVWLDLETAMEVNFVVAALLPQPPPPPTSPAPQDGGYAGFKKMPLALYKAVLRGDWVATEEYLRQDPELVEARIAPTFGTALHIAVFTGKAFPYLEKLVNWMPNEFLELKSKFGRTALHDAAMIGNLEAVKIIVRKHRDLLFVMDKYRQLPVVLAAMSAHRPTLEFLISEAVNDDYDSNHYDADNCFLLLNTAIKMDFFDIALELAERFPDQARRRYSGHSAIRTLVITGNGFASGAQFNIWERLIYSIQDTLIPRDCGCRWHYVLYQLMMRIVPRGKWIHGQKVKHQQALKLLKCLCSLMESFSEREVDDILPEVLLVAAQFGFPEVIEAIVEIFPTLVYSQNLETKGYFLNAAVENRWEKVFNLVYQMSDHKFHVLNVRDISNNSLMHLAAKLAPPHKLNVVSGAALQMQRELQWFKEVEKVSDPIDRNNPNYDGKTARMIFTEEHSNLKAEGEKWMKDTANSCSIAAALIATVVFAAAITVPGGNAENGFPLFARSSAFIMFAVSDAVSLFTSTTSLLMFLAILTSRYAEEDFLHALPKRLCVGLFTLFLSILSMMVAFSCTIYLVFGKMSGWVIIPVAVLACLPVTSFVLLQFPLLVDVISSTYGRGIFGKQSDRPFH